MLASPWYACVLGKGGSRGETLEADRRHWVQALMATSRFFQLRHRSHVLKVRNANITIGRRISCDIVTTDLRASREHARVIVGDSSAAVEDLGSANGVFVNGRRISGMTKLSAGDRIGIGQDIIEVLGFTSPGSLGDSEEATVSGVSLGELMNTMRTNR